MFTGLVAERGRVLEDPAPSERGGVLLRIGLTPELGERLSIGASLAVSGVCLTVVELAPDGTACAVEMGEETLRRTVLGELRAGSEINLEPPLRMGNPLGGHWVQGHVDGTAEVLERTDHAEHSVIAFSIPPGMEPYVVEKGSVALDGVSLTVASLERDRFTVWLIPHTLEVTTLGLRRPGDRVSFEADVLAKYVVHNLARVAEAGGWSPPGGAGEPA
jgi:riboflavin synthase